MAKAVQNKKQLPRKGRNDKLIALVTLVLALVLTITAGTLGLRGMKLDSEGLYHLLAWLPSPLAGSTWRQALVPGADLGETLVQTYSVAPLTEGEATTAQQLDSTLQILSQRLAFGGWLSARVEKLGEDRIQLTLPLDGTHGHAFELMAQPGQVGFASPDGQVFLTQKNIVKASYAKSPQDDSYAVGFVLDGVGKQIFADKTTELVGQTMSLVVDGNTVASPSIGYQPLTEGQASLPGFDQERAVAYAAMMSTQPLPLKLAHLEDSQGEALLGKNSQKLSAILLAAAALLIMLAFVWRYRLGGLVAAWLLVIQLIAIYFLAALTRAGYTLSTLLAIYVSFGLLAYGLSLLYGGMRADLSRGRSVRQALRESHGGAGALALELLGALLLLFVVLIIVDSGMIGSFARVFAMGLLLDILLIALLHRVLLGSVVTLFGSSTALYASTKKEAL